MKHVNLTREKATEVYVYAVVLVLLLVLIVGVHLVAFDDGQRELLRARQRSVLVLEGGAAWKDTPMLKQDMDTNPVEGTFPVAGLADRAGIKPGRHLQTLARNSARNCLVPAALWLRTVARESSWRPYVVSPAGAIGLAQVRPYHGHPLLDLFDPETNLNVGACLLRRHYERLRGWGLDDARAWRGALEAYHGGQYRVRTAAITRRYAAGIMAGLN